MNEPRPEKILPAEFRPGDAIALDTGDLIVLRVELGVHRVILFCGEKGAEIIIRRNYESKLPVRRAKP